MLLGSKTQPAVSVVVAYLSPLLSVPVMDHVPTPRPDSFVKVSRVGGPKINIVTDGPMITCECWAPVSAEALAVQVADLLENTPGVMVPFTDDNGDAHRAFISSWEEAGGPTQHPDYTVPEFDRWVLTVRLGIATNVN